MPYSFRLIAAVAMLASGVLPVTHAADSAIQAHCHEKWSGDAMRAYCLEEQHQAAEMVTHYSGPIRSRCESEWRNDFHMVLFCIREQQPLPQVASPEHQANSATN
ncbi:hypothetical protein [Metapseudomonas resinovorans]|uniref:Uncharacterized protein n=1 Tax=Metapseudomonas resinovorans NBRC 106553 TaxID=1245471 RepID=S6AT02_METRE|nr:hypothetical protein [Pseudomonas resinovorans]BAN47261.1 hypothetical protein PCA10_15290 [Pseudomonas resinovorans NBRC 106553]